MLMKLGPSLLLSMALSGYCCMALALGVNGEAPPPPPPSINYINRLSTVNDPTRASHKQLAEPEFRALEAADESELPPAEKDPGTPGTLNVKTIQFEGNTVISTEELNKVAAPFLNRRVDALDLEELRQRITKRYIQDGYINSGALIPDRAMTDGVLRLKIIEGKLTGIHQTEYQCQWAETGFLEQNDGLPQNQGEHCELFTLGLAGFDLFSLKGKWTKIPGDSWRGLRESYVNDRLERGAGEPLNMNGLKDSYQLLLNDPLIERVNTKLLAGKQAGESELAVRVLRARPYQLTFAYDNYTTPGVGGFAQHINGYVSNLSGWGERIDASVSNSDGAFGYDLGIDVPLNAYDTHVTFRYSQSQSSIIEEPTDRLDISNRSKAYEAGISQPLYRRPGLDLTVGLNLSLRENKTASGGVPSSFVPGIFDNHSQATVLRLWQQLVHQTGSNAFVLRSTFNKGLGVLGATVQDDGQSGEFFSWLGQTQFSQRLLDNGTHLLIKANGQFANRPLLPQERFALGGAYTVRGYRESYFVSDNAFNVQMEIHIPLFGQDPRARHSLQLVPFMDYGRAWNQRSLSDPAADAAYLHSVGVGLNWHFYKLDAEFYWAHDLRDLRPVNKQYPDLQDDGIHFRVSLNAF